MAFKNYSTNRTITDTSWFTYGNNKGNIYTGFKWEYWDGVIHYHKMESLKIKEGDLLKTWMTLKISSVDSSQ